MKKKKKQMAEFRYYRMPEGSVFLALLGKRWVQNYGRDIDYLHFHNYLEIGYCYSGEGYMVLGGEEYRFCGNEFTVIPSNYLHTTNSDPGNMSRWEYLFVDVTGLMRKLYPDNPVRGEPLVRRINSRALFEKGSSSPGQVQMLRRVFELVRKGEEFCQEEAEGLLLAFLSEIARKNAGPSDKNERFSPGSGQKQNNVISRVLDYISDHYGEPLRVEDLAGYAHLSETHFRRVFSSCMRMGPLEYVNLVRVQTACEYLKKTDDPVCMIAEKCGFSTNSTFNRNFKRIMGVSPAEWRKRPENYEQQILKLEIRSEEGW